MKLFTKTMRLHLSYAFALACSSGLHAADTITIGAGTAFTGTVGYTTRALDRYTGTLYLATNNATDATNSICYAGRNDLAVTPLATNAAISAGIPVNNIRLLNPTGQAATMLAYTRSDASKTSVYVLPFSGTNALVPSIAAGIVPFLSDGTTAAAAVSLITTGSARIFARVQKTAGTDSVSTSGIAQYLLTDPVTPTFKLVDGGGASNPAARLDNSALSATRSPNNTGAGGPAAVVVNDLAWDEDMQVLYAGLFTQVAGGNSGRGIVKGTLNATGNLTISSITAVDSLASDTSSIFSINVSGLAGTQNICINKLKVMTTSTGQKYLIVNGGMPVTAGTDVWGNDVWALRLAQTSGTNFSKGDIIANDTVAESALPVSFSNLMFDISAEVGGRPLDLDTTITVSDMIIVGDTVFVSSVLNNRTQTANGTGVKDPGIFYSRAMFNEDGLIVAWTPWQRAYPSVSNDAGTHLFGHVETDSAPFFHVDAVTGKIWKGRSDGLGIYRSKWLTVPNAIANGLQAAVSTSLSDGCFCMLDLPNGTPGIGIATGAAGTSDRNSFALFGGNNKVTFARTQSGGNYDGAHNTFIVTPPTTGQFTDPSVNFLTTSIPNVGPVRCLGYGYRQDITGPLDGYFFAGTNVGLYVYANSTGAGFNSTTALTTLAAAPFDAGSAFTWQQLGASVIGNAAISTIVTGSNNVYFTTIDTTSTGSIVDKIYSISLATPDNTPTTYSHAFAALAPTLKAQSGMGGLPVNAVFTGFTVVTNNTYDGFFGVVTTNNGIYTTTCDMRDLVQSAIATAAGTQQEWQLVPNTSGIAFSKLAPYKDMRYAFTVNANATNVGVIANINSSGTLTGQPQVQQQRNRSFEALYLADDSRGLGIYDRMRIFQGGSHGPASRTNAFNALVGSEQPVLGIPNNAGVDAPLTSRKFATNKSSNINDIDFSVFYKSDGARRFIVRCNPDDNGIYSGIRLIPYDGDAWGIGLTGPLADSNLATLPRVYCLEFISGTGHVMAGTDTGVISLE